MAIGAKIHDTTDNNIIFTRQTFGQAKKTNTQLENITTSSYKADDNFKDKSKKLRPPISLHKPGNLCILTLLPPFITHSLTYSIVHTAVNSTVKDEIAIEFNFANKFLLPLLLWSQHIFRYKSMSIISNIYSQIVKIFAL